MIITLNLTNPLIDQGPGPVLIQLELESDNEPVAFEDSFRLWINGVEVDGLTALKPGIWEISWEGNFIVDQEVLIEFQATDNDETLKSRWSFNITGTSAINLEDYVWAHSLQGIGAYLPEYTEARSKRASVYKQLMNPFGLKIDENKKKLNRHNKDLSLSQSSLEDPDWLYKYKLPGGRDFSYTVESNGEKVYEAPSAFGLNGYNKISVTALEAEDLWRSMPTRIELAETVDELVTLTPSMSILELGHFVPLRFKEPQEIYCWVHSGTSLVEVGDELINVIMRVEGLSEYGAEKNITVSLLKNGHIKIPGVWKGVLKLSIVQQLEGSYAEVQLMRLPLRGRAEDDRFLKIGGEVPRWELGADLGGSFIEKSISGNSLILDIALGQDTYYRTDKYRLFDAQGESVTLEDLALDPNSELMYGIDSSKIYVWDRRERVEASISRLSGSAKVPEVNFHIERNGAIVDSDGVTYSTLYTLENDRAQGIKLIKRWHWSVVSETGSRSYISQAGEVVSTAPQWQYNSTPIQEFGITKTKLEVDLGNTGGDVFELNVEFADGTSEVVRQIAPLCAIQAKAEYTISHLITGSKKNRIAIREDGLILVANGSKVYEVTKRFDYCSPDYAGRALLFRERYDNIEVTLDGD